jgi:hypothetical protein
MSDAVYFDRQIALYVVIRALLGTTFSHREGIDGRFQPNVVKFLREN